MGNSSISRKALVLSRLEISGSHLAMDHSQSSSIFMKDFSDQVLTGP